MMTAETLVEIVDEEDEQGSLPEGWRLARLGEICSQSKIIVDPFSDRAKQLRYLSLEHIESETGKILPGANEISSDEGKSTTFYFSSKHVLYGKLRPYLNKVALPNFEGRCTTEMVPLLPTEKAVREYLVLLLRRPDTVNAVMRETTGSRMPRADMDTLLNLRIPLPPTIEEQKRIAAMLDDQMNAVTQARAAVEAQLEAAQRLPNALLCAVFESEEAEDWERRRLGEMAKTCSGTTPSRGNLDYYKGGIPWVKTGELKDGMILDTEEHISELALKETSLKLLPSETLLVAMYGQGQTRGRTGLLLTPATTNQACFAILPNETFDSRFLQFWFRYSYDRLRQETEGRGGNQPNLNGDVLNKQMISLPSTIDEQIKIVERLNSQLQEVETLKKTLTEQLAAINKMPTALLRKAFSGEI